MKKILLALSIPLLILLFSGCKKEYLDTNSPTAITDELAFGSYETALQVLNGVLAKFYIYNNGGGQGDAGFGVMSLHAKLDMMGDDVINSILAYYMQYYRWTDIADEKGSIVAEAWDFYYDKIKALNPFLLNVKNIKEATPEQLSQLEGEARVLRAYCYHQLVQLYGKRYEKGGANSTLGVVLRDENSSLDPMPRSTVQECYDFILNDITTGLDQLKVLPKPKGYASNWVGMTVAHAIAARIYQSMGEWEKVVEHTQMSLEASVTEGFGLVADPNELLNGFNDVSCKEWIWGYDVSKEQNLGFASFFCHFAYSVQAWNDVVKFAVNRDIYDLMGPNDVRRKWWICLDLTGGVYPPEAEYYFTAGKGPEETGTSVKFDVSIRNDKGFPGDNYVMRLPMIYYMRAEALARLNRDAEAQGVLNEVMVTRDPDYAVTVTGQELIDEILRNKRIELWLEGERFFDMKRLGVVPNRLESKNAAIIRAKYSSKYDVFVSRNSGENAEYIAKDAQSPNWEFMIPLKEIEGALEEVVQNPQHVRR